MQSPENKKTPQPKPILSAFKKNHSTDFSMEQIFQKESEMDAAPRQQPLV